MTSILLFGLALNPKILIFLKMSCCIKSRFTKLKNSLYSNYFSIRLELKKRIAQ